MASNNCDKCGRGRILAVFGKVSDLLSLYLRENGEEFEYRGYVPKGIGLRGADGKDEGEDYLDINICLDCGKAQGSFPIPNQELNLVFFGDEGEYAEMTLIDLLDAAFAKDPELTDELLGWGLSDRMKRSELIKLLKGERR